MKNVTFYAILIVTFILGLTACKKNEQALEAFERVPSSPKVETFVPTKVTNTAGAYFQSIDTVCAPYLTYSVLIDIRRVPEGAYHAISDGNLTLETPADNTTFYNYKDHPDSWWFNWNKPPFVENENPTVWSVNGSAPTMIKLSKKCYVLGFELSAAVNDFDIRPNTYVAKYTSGDQLIGFISNVVVAPNGARLFAVKSDLPFDGVEIFYSGNAPVPEAWAIANIRYVTDKAVYDAHK
jgi:hypothetical protein